MKIVALMPVKNEEAFLPITIPPLKKVADKIIILDDASTDKSVEIARKHGAIVIDTPKNQDYQYMSAKRELLLEHGRKMGGTHFLWIDADEILVCKPEQFKFYIAKMHPGAKCVLPWISLWKSPNYYREDTSVWSKLEKDFVVADAKNLTFEKRYFSEGRTQGPNNKKTWQHVPQGLAYVLHLQFVPWQRFQMKQAWYRCAELVKTPKKYKQINHQYAITLDDPSAKCSPTPKEWLNGIKIPKEIENLPPAWHKKAILDYFDKYGIEFFEPLQIWHVTELKKEFIKRTGREPKTKTYGPIITVFRKMLSNLVRKVN